MQFFTRALWLGLVVVFAGACPSSTDTDGTPSGLTTTSSGSTVVIGDDWRACEEIADCVLVDTSCDGCCQRDAIARSVESAYDSERLDACEDYVGGECDCCFVVLEAVCSPAGLCEAATPAGSDPGACE